MFRRRARPFRPSRASPGGRAAPRRWRWAGRSSAARVVTGSQISAIALDHLLLLLREFLDAGLGERRQARSSRFSRSAMTVVEHSPRKKEEHDDRPGIAAGQVCAGSSTAPMVVLHLVADVGSIGPFRQLQHEPAHLVGGERLDIVVLEMVVEGRAVVPESWRGSLGWRRTRMGLPGRISSSLRACCWSPVMRFETSCKLSTSSTGRLPTFARRLEEGFQSLAGRASSSFRTASPMGFKFGRGVDADR